MKLNPEQEIFLREVISVVRVKNFKEQILEILNTGEYNSQQKKWINACKVVWYKKLNRKITESQ